MRKVFTVEEANRAISLVRPIVQDILEKMSAAEHLRAEVKMERDNPEVQETILLSKLAEAEKMLNAVEYHLKELDSVGVFLKDLKLGLVDFPCVHEGRIIYLCWKIGEETINSWHELYEGFTHRKPLDASFRMMIV